MQALRTDLIEIVRDFMIAHRTMQKLFRSHRGGTLRFEEVQALVDDSAKSVLFRLKERCHALFRSDSSRSGVTVRREALFDLAVGSLFHEAMKVRENLYQQEVYGPRVRSLRREIESDASGLLDEFERIIAAAAERLEEALLETERLLTQTRDQLRILLVDHRDDGLIARYLVENPALVGEVFDLDLEALLVGIYGSASAGYGLASESYLGSAHFSEALVSLDLSADSSEERSERDRLAHYARGMEAFLRRDYRASLDHLAQWLDAGPPDETSHASVALAAVSRVSRLAEGDERDSLVADASSIAARIESFAGLAAEDRSAGQVSADDR